VEDTSGFLIGMVAVLGILNGQWDKSAHRRPATRKITGAGDGIGVRGGPCTGLGIRVVADVLSFHPPAVTRWRYPRIGVSLQPAMRVSLII
jgi:hypothetical protein